MSLLRKSDEHGEFSRERPDLIAASMDSVGGVEDAMRAYYGRQAGIPNYGLPYETHPITFAGTISEVLELHDRKNQDYGTDADPFANVRQSEQFGVPAWLGAIIRLNDKITRIKAWTRNKSLANESLRDSLIDIVVYGAIAVTLFDQEQDSDRTFCP